MHERLLDKTLSPTFDDLIAYSAGSGALWLELDKHIRESFSAQRQIRFPYGNTYGWSSKYSAKGKHICDIFAENGAFALHFRLGNSQLASVYAGLSEHAQKACNDMYPCNGGGWVTYRVLSPADITDAKKLVYAKMNLQQHGG